jgi:hypothetical protein
MPTNFVPTPPRFFNFSLQANRAVAVALLLSFVQEGAHMGKHSPHKTGKPGAAKQIIVANDDLKQDGGRTGHEHGNRREIMEERRRRLERAMRCNRRPKKHIV